MSNYTKHTVNYLEIESLQELYKSNNIPDFSNLGLILSSKFPICKYLYSKVKRSPNNKDIFIIQASYNKNIIKVIDILINEFVFPDFQLGKSLITIRKTLATIGQFIEFCYKHEYKFYRNVYEAKKILEYYIYSLKEDIRRNKIAACTAYVLSRKAFLFLTKIFEIDRDVLADVELLEKVKNINAGTVKPEDKKLNYAIRFYYNLFLQLTDFLLEKKHYPYKIKLYKDEYFILPLTRWTKPNGKYYKNIFDFKSGIIHDEDNIKQLYKYKYSASKLIDRLSKKIEYNNLDFYTKERFFLGTIALKAYYMHFLAITGMNDSTAATLLWNDNYKIDKKSQSFKTIKYRAGNKPVEFTMQSKSIPNFKKFLELREYLLQSNEEEHLFFNGYKDKTNNSFTQKSGSFSSQINSFIIKTIDSKLPNVTSKEYRVNKTYYNIQKYGIVIASQLAQSSITTIMKHYHGESEESSGKQLTEYFNQLNQSIIFSEDKGKSINVGQCSQINNPKSEIELNSIDIKCSQSEGCLFCEHYGCHVDDIDVRKLYSLLYIINESRYIAKSEKHFNSVYGVVIDRINNILEYIKKQESKLNFDEIKNDVMVNENLDLYWERKLVSLINMGVLK